MTFEYDKLNNVTSRNDNKLKVNQNYIYDNLNRLTNAYTDTKQNSTFMSYNYDALGNMTYKSDIGSYQYSSSNPHQVEDIGSKHFAYDSIGNMTNNNGTLLKYNSFNKTSQIIKLITINILQIISRFWTYLLIYWTEVQSPNFITFYNQI